MKSTFYFKIMLFALSIILISSIGCKRDIEDLELATYSTNGDVFIDAFSAGLEYAAFGGSKVTAFEVDMDDTYKGEAAMRFEVPDAGDPQGAYAGGSFFVEGGRDLSGYDALTFWVKASKPAVIDLIGFGNDLAESKYLVELNDIAVNSNWEKIVIPIPDASKLTQERGLLFFSEGPEDGVGYTFWMDEVRFEKLGTLAHQDAAILLGQDQTAISETGQDLVMGGFTTTFNLPTGIDQVTSIAPSYFTFTSSAPSTASVNSFGVVTVLDAGDAVITATLGEIEAMGSLSLSSTGEAVVPLTPAPVPTTDPDSVISMFSNVYDDVPVDVWNTFWEFSTAMTDDIQVNGDDIKRYTNLNFVGIEFTSQTIDASEMTHFHMDIWTPSPTDLPASFKVLLVDFGANNTFDGGDDSSHELSFTSPTLSTGNWISLDMPLANFVGLTNRSNLAQLVLSGELPTVFVDNVYFYESDNTGTGGGDTPTTAAPTPNQSAANVTSVFSDAYTGIAGTNFYPDWGQGNTVSEVSIAGNNTLLYSNLDYQGIELGSSQDVSGMDFLHIDYWTNNSSSLNTYLISSGAETASAMTVPTSGWGSVNIPLSAFAGVDLTDVIQLKFDGNGTIYLDNIYFYTTNGGGGGDDEPSLPLGFEDGETLIPFDNGATAANIPNPDNGGNPSANVLEFRKTVGSAWYSGVVFDETLRTTPLIDLSNGTVFTVKMWSPNAGINVRFQLEGGFPDPGAVPAYEVFQTITTANQWVTLTFDFTSQVNPTHQYTKFSLFPDFDPSDESPVAVESIYYIDDIIQQ